MGKTQVLLVTCGAIWLSLVFFTLDVHPSLLYSQVE